jgi:FAD/FMN-containing dehydrogenase
MPLSPDFIAELKKNFSGGVSNDIASRVLYSTDASIYQIEPLGVAFPKTQDDLQAAVELAAKYKIPILPRGAGSSLAGQAIGEALILDCSRWLDKLVDIDPEARAATVEPGLVLSRLNAAAAKHGLIFGPDPGLRGTRHAGRCHRQQRDWRPFHPVRHDRRPPGFRRRDPGRWQPGNLGS